MRKTRTRLRRILCPKPYACGQLSPDRICKMKWNEIPRSFLKSVMAQTHTEPAVGELNILVVEDNSDGAQCYERLLSICGHRVRIAQDGASALRTAEEWQPDVALIDIALPDMDGYGVARQLAQRVGRRPFLVAITG